MTYNKKRPNLH